MYIVQVASEVAPMAKVGGLSDVLLGLSRQQKAEGHTVDVVIPKYDCLDTSEVTLQPQNMQIKSFFQGAWHDNSLWKAHLDEDFAITFLESHHPSLFFERGCIYGCLDDIDRFTYFSRAVLDWLAETDKIPDIIHIHDWMTASIALLIRQGTFKKRFEKTRVVMTIHNLAYQGKCSVVDLDKIGLTGVWYEAPGRAQDDFGRDLNLLKGGIVFSDFITTVSHTYAKEVLHHEGGMGLHLTLQNHHHKFIGILNGLDYTYWNPETDPYIPVRLKDPVSFKKKNKEVVRKLLGLASDPVKPLVVVVTRLVHQKGIELIRHAICSAHEKGMQIVVLGTAPDPVVKSDFAMLAERYENDPDIRILLEQEEKLAHKLYAGADIFLVPSIFEPCGLTQLIALRYGAIPVVRKTGGLADTVFDVDFSGRPFEQTNGFSFDHADVQGLDSALERALSLCKYNKERWQMLVSQAMQCDYSWKASANLYLNAYRKILDAKLDN